MNVLLLAHEGHSHGPDVGLIALLIAAALVAVVLLLRLVAQRHHGSSSDRKLAAPEVRSAPRAGAGTNRNRLHHRGSIGQPLHDESGQTSAATTDRGQI